jgi:hypothetical protein
MVNNELIIDLAKLLKKHGTHSFEELATYLRTPENIDNLILILENTSKANKAVFNKAIRKVRPQNQVPKNLNGLRNINPEKFDFLNQFYQKLISKQILPTLREINFFREDNGFSVSKVKSHKVAIKSLVNDLANFPMEKLMNLVTPISENKGLQGWSDIILNKKQDIS